MLEQGFRNPECGADKFGFKKLHAIHWNLLEPELYECALNGGEAQDSAPKPVCTRAAAPKTNISSATT